MDFEAEFKSIAERLQDIPEVSVAIDLLSLNQVVEYLNEAALHLSRFISKVIAIPGEVLIEFPDELVPMLPTLIAMCDQLTESIHGFICEECNTEYCDDEECEECRDDTED